MLVLVKKASEPRGSFRSSDIAGGGGLPYVKAPSRPSRQRSFVYTPALPQVWASLLNSEF